MKTHQKKYFGVSYIVIVALGSIALSLGMIIFLYNFEPKHTIELVNGKALLPTKSIWLIIGEHIATALFILGIWHALDQLLIKREFNEEVINEFNDANELLKSQIVSIINELKSQIINDNQQISEKLKMDFKELSTYYREHLEHLGSLIVTAKHDAATGLVSVHHDSNSYNYSNMIETANSLTAVLADGFYWTAQHVDAFINRFQDQAKKTKFILAHPQAEIIEVIARKAGMKPDIYRERIYGTIRHISQLSAGKVDVKFIGHTLITSHSLFIADREIIYSPYFMSTQRRTPPVFVFKDAGSGSFYQKLVHDINYLEKECAEIKIPEDQI